MIDRTKVSLGKRAPRIDSRTLRMSTYRTAKAGPITVPVADGYITKVPDWPMYLNDTLGDCVAAAAGHCIEQWTEYAGDFYQPTDAEILAFYETQNPPPQDDGMVMLTALNTWRQNGVGKHKIDAFVSIDPTNRKEVEEAIYLFGNIYIGLALPLTAQTGDVWQVPPMGLNGDGSPGSWGGHCVPAMGFQGKTVPGHPEGLMVVTWGQLMPMTWAFLESYCDEAYAILSPDWIDNKGDTIGGLNVNQLKADLKLVTA